VGNLANPSSLVGGTSTVGSLANVVNGNTGANPGSNFNVINPNSNNPNRLSNILNTVNPTGSNPTGNIPTGNIPNINFPAGNNPTGNIPNVNIATGTTSQISTTTTRTIIELPNPVINLSPEIAQTNFERSFLFERQTTANRAIAQLLGLIQEKNNDIRTLESQIPRLQTTINVAITRQTEIQERITMAQMNKQKIEDAIAVLTGRINNAKGNLDNLRQTTITTTTQRANLQRQFDDVSNLIIRLENERAGLVERLRIAERNLEQNLIEQDKIRAELDELRRLLQVTQDELNNIIANIATAERNVRDANNEVARLEDLLRIARQTAATSQNRLNELNQLRANGPRRIAEIQTQIRNKESSLLPLQRQENALTTEISSLKNLIANIEDQIRTQRDNINGLIADIEAATASLTTLNGNLNSGAGDINVALSDLQFLQNQLPAFDSELRSALAEGQSITVSTTQNRNNLAALIARLDRCQQEIQQLTVELQRARTLKSEADNAVNIIADNTATGVQATVTNVRNNNQNLISANSLILPNGGNLLVNPSLNTLNSLSGISNFNGQLFSLPTGNIFGGLSNFSCSNVSGGQTIEGIVQRINGGAMSVKGTNGNLFNVDLSPCSQLFAPTPNYNFGIGSTVSLYGTSHGSGFNAYQGICY
jgi:chromosome segregation ATPase